MYFSKVIPILQLRNKIIFLFISRMNNLAVNIIIYAE
jgi:hypothetical protein